MTVRLASWILATLWIAAVAYLCLAAWPTIPLDLDAKDPALQAAYERARLLHAVRYALAALVPAALLLAVARILTRQPPR